jgi:plastocyanin
MGEHMTTTTTQPDPAQPAGAAGGLARWSHLASFGFLMTACGPLLMILAGTAWGLDAEDVPFFAIVAVLALAAAALVRQRRTALKVIGVVLGLLAGVAMFWTAFGLTYPGSVLDFVPGLLVLPGALLGLVAGIASIRAQRRGDLGSSPQERRAIPRIAAAIGVLALVSLVLTVAGRETVSDDEAASADVTITISDFEFDDDEGYELEGGSTVLVKNDDPLVHTFTVDDLDIDETLSPGSEKLITIPDQPGEFILYCEPHTGDPDEEVEDDMSTTLTIG